MRGHGAAAATQRQRTSVSTAWYTGQPSSSRANRRLTTSSASARLSTTLTSEGAESSGASADAVSAAGSLATASVDCAREATGLGTRSASIWPPATCETGPVCGAGKAPDCASALAPQPARRAPERRAPRATATRGRTPSAESSRGAHVSCTRSPVVSEGAMAERNLCRSDCACRRIQLRAGQCCSVPAAHAAARRSRCDTRAC